MSGLVLGPAASVSCVAPATSNTLGNRRRRFPPIVERIRKEVISPFCQIISSISNPPRVRSPCTSPSAHACGSAGSRCTKPAWLCTSISAIPAQQPKLPSIWKGACASNILAYVPPSGSFIVASGDMSLSCVLIIFSAWSPSSIRAHWHTFHPIDHPRAPSPRPISDLRTA